MPSLARVSCLLLELWYIKVKCIRIKCLVRLINACRLFCRPTDIGRILVHARVGRIEAHFIKRILFMRRVIDITRANPISSTDDGGFRSEPFLIEGEFSSCGERTAIYGLDSVHIVDSRSDFAIWVDSSPA